jgi:hypothetical protein
MTAATIRRLRAALALCGALTAAVVCAAPFTPGNVVVYRVGDGVANLVATGNAVFLDEYSPSGTLVQTTFLQGALNSGNATLFCAGLTAFAKQVALLSGGGIPAAQAAQLVASANRIKAVQGCR